MTEANFFQVYTTADQCIGRDNHFRDIIFNLDDECLLQIPPRTLPEPTPTPNLISSFPITQTGYYIVNYLASFIRDHSKHCHSRKAYLQVAVNGKGLPPTSIHVDLEKSNTVETISNNVIVYLEAGNTVSLQFAGGQNMHITSSCHKTHMPCISASFGMMFLATIPPEPLPDPIPPPPYGPAPPPNYTCFIEHSDM